MRLNYLAATQYYVILVWRNCRGINWPLSFVRLFVLQLVHIPEFGSSILRSRYKHRPYKIMFTCEGTSNVSVVPLFNQNGEILFVKLICILTVGRELKI